MDALLTVAMILAGLVAGGALNNAIAMIPALRRLDDASEREVRRAASELPVRYMAAASLASGVVGAALLAFYSDPGPAMRALLGTGVGLSAALLATLWISWRVERAFRDPRELGPSADFQRFRVRWAVAQLGSATTAIALLASYAAAAAAS